MLKIMSKFCNQRQLWRSETHLQNTHNLTRFYPIVSLSGNLKSSSCCCFATPLYFSEIHIRRLDFHRQRTRQLVPRKCQTNDPAIISSHEDDISKPTLLWRAIKLPIYSVALVPLTVGTAAAYLQTGLWSAKQYGLLLASSLLIITWLNLSNDVYDFDTGADINKKESVVNMIGSRSGTLMAALLLLGFGSMGLGWAAMEAGNVRSMLVLFLDENSKQDDHVQKEAAHDRTENSFLQLELERSQEELEKCRNNLNFCLERNEKLCREIADLNAFLENQKSAVHDHGDGIVVIKEPILEALSVGDKALHTFHNTSETHVTHSAEVMDMQLEEASVGDESFYTMKNEISAKYIEEVTDLQLKVDILEIILKEESSSHGELKEEKLNKMHDSLERAWRTNKLYKSEREFNAINEEEMDQVRKQVEAETAEVIVCLQEEINSLQKQLHDSSMKESEVKRELTLLQENYKEKERQLNIQSEEFRFLTNEIEKVLTTGHEALEDALNDLDDVTVCEKLQIITRNIFEKESRIKELNSCLEDAKNKGNEMEGMLRSLKGATMIMSEAHQQDCNGKDQIICQLSSQLSEKSCTIAQVINAIKEREEQIRKVLVCATGVFVIVNRFSEMKDGYLEALTQKEDELDELKKSHMIGTEKSRGINNDTIILLRKELETALGSLNGVKTEMARLRSEKEVVVVQEN